MLLLLTACCCWCGQGILILTEEEKDVDTDTVDTDTDTDTDGGKTKESHHPPQQPPKLVAVVQEEEEEEEDEYEPPNIVHFIDSVTAMQTLLSQLQPSVVDNVDDTIKIPTIIVAVVYKDTCATSMRQFQLFQEAMDGLPLFYTNILHLHFVNIPVTSQTLELLDSIPLHTVPSILFMKQPTTIVSQTNANNRTDLWYVLEADHNHKRNNRTMTVEDLVAELHHYLLRMAHSNMSYKVERLSGTHKNNNHSRKKLYLDAMTLEMSNRAALQTMVSKYQELFVRRILPKVIPLDPGLSTEEQAWIRYLLSTTDIDDNDEVEDPLHIFCQCRTTTTTVPNSNDDDKGAAAVDDDEDDEVVEDLDDNDEEEDLDIDDKEEKEEENEASSYSDFDQLASVLSVRRDTAFCIFRYNDTDDDDDNDDTCQSDGEIHHYHIANDENWSLELKSIHTPATTDTDVDTTESSGIVEFISKALRPTIMWLDRQMTAPIAMAHYYQVHAVLFVDFHVESTKEEMRRTIQTFRRECIQHKSSMVCLVVPSTETRILTTFGIDLWTQLDPQVTTTTTTTKDDGDHSAVLPTLLITDQREGLGIRRYYLDPPIIHNPQIMSQFFDDFWKGRATSELKSRYPTTNDNNDESSTTAISIPTNSHNVHLLTATTLDLFVNRHPLTHSLVLLYAPTCGHCKRFNLVWNQLGDLLEYLGWNLFLELGRLDVSSNEYFVPGMAAPWLPDVYYFGPTTTKTTPIRYTSPSQELVGGISDPMELIDWWLDLVADDDTVDPVKLLHDLEQNNDKDRAQAPKR
jgi:hypothetical protein